MSSPENTALRRGRLALAAIAVLTLLLPACKEAVTRGAVSSSSSGSSKGTAPTTVPWYPSGKNQELVLSWVVHPMASESEGGPRRNIEIIARIEGATYRAALGAHDGVLFADEQSACNPSLKSVNLVSVIHFVTMGPETIVARRTQPTLLEIDFTVEADDEPAKLHGTLATIPIPADARVVDAICAIGAGGEKRAIDCSSKKEEPWGPKSNGTGEGRAQ